MQPGPLSLLPPLVAIGLAIATRRVIVPLALGVFSGAWLLTAAQPDAAWWQSAVVFVKAIVESIRAPSHLQVLGFTLLLGAMVGVLEAGGGMKALVAKIAGRIRSRRGAQSMIGLAGLIIFFDDYANTLLVGGTMRSTADRFRVSRAKLAYLVDSTAAPIAGLAFISTWVATEISYLESGIEAAGVELSDGSSVFGLFLQSVPYRFYPWLALVMVFCVAATGRDFGPMRREEASRGGQPGGDPGAAIRSPSTRLWLAAVLPIVFCVLAVLCVLVWTGVGQETTAESVDAGFLQLAGTVLGQGDSYLALLVGGAVGLVVAFAAHNHWGDGNAYETVGGALRGGWQMMPAMAVLWLAWALSAMTEPDALDTGGYLTGVLSDRLDPRLLPTAVFLLAGATAFSTGTSWGTMAILTPLAVALAVQLVPAEGAGGAVSLATFGAVLAGAIFGDHCSPISDTTVLSSRACGCDHVLHVRTQLPYALLVAAICVVFGTLPAAVGVSPWLSLLVGSLVVYGALRLLGRPIDPAPREDSVAPNSPITEADGEGGDRRD